MGEDTRERPRSSVLKLSEWDNEISPTKIYPEVRALAISNCKSSELNLSAAPLEQLTSLFISYCEDVEEIKLQPNTKLPELTALSISMTSVRTFDLSFLKHSLKLESLFLSRSRISEIDISPLSQLKNLHQIGLSNNEIREVNLSDISSDRIVGINIAGNGIAFGTLDLSGLDRWQHLRRLCVGGNEFSTVDITSLMNIPGFEYTDLCTGKGSYAYLVADERYRNYKLPIGIQDLLARDHVSIGWYNHGSYSPGKKLVSWSSDVKVAGQSSLDEFF